MDTIYSSLEEGGVFIFDAFTGELVKDKYEEQGNNFTSGNEMFVVAEK